MGIRPEFRWWILTVVVVGVLLLISALALDRKNVIWEEGVPHCPHCQSEVAFYSVLCQTCTERYDWKLATAEASPLSRWSLSSLEARFLRDRMQALGDAAAARRLAEALALPGDAAKRYLEKVDRGSCGWCGGTGRDLASADEKEDCPVCFGTGRCIACGGDRRVQVGDEAAHAAYLVYASGVTDVRASVGLPADVELAEVKRLTRDLVTGHAGTLEATKVLFWPAWPTLATAVDTARGRLDRVLQALSKE